MGFTEGIYKAKGLGCQADPVERNRIKLKKNRPRPLISFFASPTIVC